MAQFFKEMLTEVPHIFSSQNKSLMLFHYQKIRKVTEVLNDLVKIHNDRIATYELALSQSTNLSPDLKDEFSNLIEGGKQFKEQLNLKLRELNGDTTKSPSIFGMIYMAWMDLKVVLAANTQKAIITSCLYNEEIALHAYTAALNMKIEMSRSIRNLIEEHEAALRDIHNRLGKYRETRNFADQGLVYFN